MLFFTIAGKSQAANALVLGRSIKQHHPKAMTVLCLVDHYLSPWNVHHYDHVLRVTNNGTPSRIDRHYIAAKAYLIKYLTTAYASYSSNFIYLDPETRLHSPLHELNGLLEKNPIIAVPATLEPSPTVHGDNDRLKYGFLHTGFMAFRSSEKVRDFAFWFSRHIDESFYRHETDLFADHRWASAMSVAYEMLIYKNYAYNVGAWNLWEAGRQLQVSPEQGITAGGSALRTFHYGNVDGTLDQAIEALQGGDSHPAKLLVSDYEDEVAAVRKGLSGSP